MKVKEYNEIVSNYSNRVCRFVDKIIMNREAARDITQEAFMKLWENRSNVDPAKARSWLFTTSYRLSLRYIENSKRFTDTGSIPERYTEPGPPDLQKILNQAFCLLSEKQKSIIILRDHEGYSYKEIGELLELNEPQVKVYLFRARQIIKDYIKDLNLVF